MPFAQSDYWFFPDTGRLVPQNKDEQSPDLPLYGSVERALRFRGNFKLFLVGGTLVLFREDDFYFLQMGTMRWRLGSPDLNLSRRIYGPFGFLSVIAPKFQRTFVEWRLGARIQKATDVTYDALDEVLDDFSGEILRIHDKCKNYHQ